MEAAPVRTAFAVPEPSAPLVLTTRWPLDPTPSPVLAELRPEDEASYEAVARAIAARESDPFARIKAMHDWIALHVAYDVDEARHDDPWWAGTRTRPARGPELPTLVAPLQDPCRALDEGCVQRQVATSILRTEEHAPVWAATTFATRRGVCAGYANLLTAMARVTGDDIRYVVGTARVPDESRGMVSALHAWNVARIDGRQYPIDVTWDAGTTQKTGYVRDYGTDYLFTPPEIFRADHLPRDDRDQIAPAVSDAALEATPMLRAPLRAAGVSLVSPTRLPAPAQDIVLANPFHVELQATTSDGVRCISEDSGAGAAARTRLRCGRAPGAPRWVTVLFRPHGRSWDYGAVFELADEPASWRPFVGQTAF